MWKDLVLNSKIQIIIIDDNESNRDLLLNLLARERFDVILAPNGKIALNLIKKNKPHLALINLLLQDISGIEILEKIKILSPITDCIVMTDFTNYDLLIQVIGTNAATGFLDIPVDKLKLTKIIDDILDQKRTLLETQKTVDSLFESYNQIEFLLTILTNDYESYTKILNIVIDLLQSSELSDSQEKSLKILKDLFFNNTRLLERFNNLQSLGDPQPANFKKIDIVEVLAEILDDIKSKNPSCNLIIPEKLVPGKYFVRATCDELLMLFTEVLYSLSLPLSNFCKSIVILIRESEFLVNSEGNNIHSIEVEIRSSLDSAAVDNDDSIVDITHQQYGFGFFLVKSLVDNIGGRILLEDSKVDNETITTMVIVLPSY